MCFWYFSTSSRWSALRCSGLIKRADSAFAGVYPVTSATAFCVFASIIYARNCSASSLLRLADVIIRWSIHPVVFSWGMVSAIGKFFARSWFVISGHPIAATTSCCSKRFVSSPPCVHILRMFGCDVPGDVARWRDHVIIRCAAAAQLRHQFVARPHVRGLHLARALVLESFNERGIGIAFPHQQTERLVPCAGVRREHACRDANQKKKLSHHSAPFCAPSVVFVRWT